MPPKKPADDIEDDFESTSTRELLIATRKDLVYLNRDLTAFTQEIKDRLSDHDVKIRALELCEARTADPTILQKRLDTLEKRIGDLENKLAEFKGGARWVDYLLMAIISAVISGGIGLIFWTVMN